VNHPEYRSRTVSVHKDWGVDELETTCNEWAKEGFEVFSVICPQPSNYHTFRITAVKYPAGTTRPSVGRRFR
jgi:hypothetical protein